MCEGHCHKMQDIVRAQEGVNHGTVRDLIGRTQQLVTLMTKDEDALKKLDDDELDLLKAALDFLTEVRSSTRDWRRRPTTHRLPTPCFARPSRLQCVQGPNEENQNRLAGSTTITSCKEIISYVATCSCDSLKKKVARLKSSSVGLLVSLLEGRPDFLVHETMEEHIDVSLLRRRILQIYEDNVEEPEEPGAALGSLAKLYPFGMMSGALAKPVTCAPCELEEIRNIFSLIEIVVQQRREHLASLQDLEASLHVERGELNLLDPIGEQQQQRRQRVVLLLVGDAHLVRVRVGVRGRG